MQTDYKQIYKMAAEKHGNSEQLYKDLGNFVFNSLYNNLRKPKSLILKLKGIGNWYLRKRRMEIVVARGEPVREISDAESETIAFKHENKLNQYKLFKDRLAEYDEYIKLRNEIRIKRNETQRLLQPTNRQD